MMPVHSRNGSTAVIYLILLSAVLAACTLNGCNVEDNGGAGSTPDQSIYTIADPTGDWGYPSPYTHYARGPGYVRMSLIFDTLVWKDESGLIPALAESWLYLEEQGAYRFNLRRDVTWHDGKAFTAADVVFTMEYIKRYPYQFVDGAKVREAVAADSYTVDIYLEHPDASFLDSVAGTLPVLPAHIWEDVDNPYEYIHQNAVTGNGPYMLIDYNKAQGTYLYGANPDYYGGEPRFEQLRFVRVSPEMAGSALRQKKVSAAQVPAELVPELAEQELAVVTGSHDWMAKLMINHTREPLDSREFRQALVYAIDRTALVETCLRGHALPGSPGLLPPDHPWHEPGAGIYSHDLGRAGEIIESLGYIKNTGGYYEKDGAVLELELLISGSPGPAGAPGEREGEMLQRQLAAAGIKVNLRSLEAKTLDNRVLEWQFDLALIGHGGVGGDPAVLARLITGPGFNSARYTAHEQLVELLERQGREMDLAERQRLVGEIQVLYAGEMPALPLYYPTWYWAHDGRADLFYTKGGIGTGVPIPLNKIAFVEND